MRMPEYMDSIFEAFVAGVPVLTVNSRLSRHLLSAFDGKMRSEGRTGWPTPVCMPFGAWVLSVWGEHGERPLLTDARAKVLWERVAAAGSLGGLLPGVASASYDAYRLMNEYAIELPKDELYLTEEAGALKRWSRGYDGELSRLGYVDASKVPYLVSGLVKRGVEVPRAVVLAGFDELTPALESVRRALEARSVAVSSWPAGPQPAGACAAAARAADQADEVRMAARWIRSVAAPGVRIGVVVPELERYRPLLLREFAAELNPASVLPGRSPREVFNISLGEPLSEEPLVSSALDIVSMGEGRAEIGLVSRIIKSPFFAGAEREIYAKADARLREANRQVAGVHDLTAMLQGWGADARRFERWGAWLREARLKKTPSDWARAFTELLGKTDWLKGMTLTSAEHQALEGFYSALEVLSSLNDFSGAMTRPEAASRLITICRERLHQRETPECNIQVLGLLESAGLAFDRLWCMGCHEYSMPAQQSPNPFIPLNLQRARGLPRSSPERELAFGRRAAVRLLGSAPEVIVSYPAEVDGRPMSVSRFFSGLPAAGLGLAPSSRLVDSIAPGAAEDAPPDPLSPVSEAEKGFLRGGTSIIKDQSICPFRAFALHRLSARPIAEVAPGLRPWERGTIVHAAMKLFWEKVESSRRLKELRDNGGLAAFISEMAAKAVGEAKAPPPLSSRYLEIEKRRVEALISRWVEVELGRGPFRVKAVEAEREIEIGGLRLRGRIDRVDELEGGGEAVIDYKTGGADQKDWFAERPREPQLLVYSAAGAVSAVSFARITARDCRFVGISRDESALPGVTAFGESKLAEASGAEDWDALLARWSSTVEALAGEFMAGRAEVDPAGGPGKGADSACRYCELPILCRVQVMDTEEGGGGDRDEDDSVL